MRIYIVANGYPSKREPQWGCFERDQALALRALGHDVAILYADKRFRIFWRKIGFSHYYENGLKVCGIFLFPTHLIRLIFGNSIQYWVATRLLDIVYKKCVTMYGCPDVIYAHYLHNIAYSAFLRGKYGIPLVGIEHWSVLNQADLPSLVIKRGKIAYNNTDKLLAVSQSLQTQIKMHFGKVSIVVYDMLGQEFISPKVSKKEKNDGIKYIAVGSLLPIKGYNILINAFVKSGLTNMGCSLSIVGDGPERTVLKQIIKESKLENSIILHGRKTKKEIIQLLSDSHVFVLSSKAETFGVACIEALSQGLPAIATKCGGPEEIIDDTNGILVEVGNEDAMSEAMCKMYDNYCQYDNVAIANECLSKFSPHVIASQLTEIFNEVTK